MRCAIVASTGGSVMNELLKNAFFKHQICTVVSDRPCPAIDKASRHGIPVKIIAERDKLVFSNRLLEYLRNQQVDYVFSFFTRLFVGELLRCYRDRIVNLHPSLLPAFKGLNGFSDALAYGVRYVGTTIHFVDERMDEGKIILQSVCPLDTHADPAVLRHHIFQQQCKSLLQVVKWLADRRIHVFANRVVIDEARFIDYEFSPNLDFEEAIKLDIPLNA